MKRILAVFLSALMTLSLVSCTTNNAPAASPASAEQPEATALQQAAAESPSDEFSRAIWYGFADAVPSSDDEVTELQLVDMLEKMLQKVDTGAAAQWMDMTAAVSKKRQVYRDYGALMLLIAAELIDYTDFNHRQMSTPYHPESVEWDSFFEASDEYPLFSDMANATCISIGQQKNDPAMDYRSAAMLFCFSRFSLANGASLLETDENHMTRNTERMTYREAALSVIRLYESDPSGLSSLTEDAAAVQLATEILADAGAQRDKIQTSQTAISKSDSLLPGETYSGVAYYVSNLGSDQNDGRSEESPFASIDAVNAANLQSGDAVFFERGGVWRGSMIQTRPGVTYSAYGTGEKPRLVGSPENGSGAEKWSLWHECEDGSKIWVYERELPDCGGIVLNGTQGTKKLVGFWNGSEYLYCPTWQYQAATGMPDEEYQKQPPLDIISQLSENLSFFSKADSLLPDTLPIYTFGWIVGDQELLRDSVGPLYLRCDEGNPGKLYESIEFINVSGPFDGVVSQCTIDNLFIGFYNDGILSFSEGNGSVVQNCEVCWCGGYVSSYSNDRITGYSAGAPRSAGGVGATCTSDITIRNNYIHDMYHAGAGVEIFVEQNDVIKGAENISITGNIVYHCSTGLNYFNWDEEENPNHMFQNVVFEDNYVLFCGMSDWLMDRNSVAIGIDGGPNLQENCAFRNNAFFGAADTLLYINRYVQKNLPDFEGNRYLQLGSGGYLWADWADYYSSLDAETVVRDLLQDETGRFGVLHHDSWNTLDW